jgi:hypothetical protein
MTMPTLTPQHRADALVKAAAARAARAAIKAQLKSREITLAAVLARTAEPAIGKMRVSALLQALPAVGKVKAAKTLAELGIADTRRVAGLGDRQRQKLLEIFAA